MDDNSLWQQINKNRVFRKKLAESSHYWFFHIYLSHYVKHPTAEFQKEIIFLTENENIKRLVLVAFRGSGKSTLISLSYVIWSVLGKPQKKFVVLTSLTSKQSRLLLSAIKAELEKNELLINDFGSFSKEDQEWRSNSLVISKYQARISSYSTGESIRGAKHNQFRPDLIICDDIEDLSSVKTQENRDKTAQWLTGEVIPAGDTNTKLIIVGNLLHEDSIICRLEKKIEEGQFVGEFRKYPLLDNKNQCLWPEKFATQGAIDELRAQTENDLSWYREYLLKIISDYDQIIHPNWIQYYPQLPEKILSAGFIFRAIGVDLAISTKESADYTSMVAIQVHQVKGEKKIFVLPNPINQRSDFPQTVDTLIHLHNSVNGTLYIESNGFQEIFVHDLQKRGIPAKGVKTGSQDKRARLALISHLIHDGTIMFPLSGADELIKQLVGFGVERHDDLVDALTLVVLSIIDDPPAQYIPKINLHVGNIRDSAYRRHGFR